MAACVVCYEKPDASALPSCPRDGCAMLTCKECAERMVPSGDARRTCSEDVVPATAGFSVDSLSKALPGMQLEQKDKVHVVRKLPAAEKKRRADEDKLRNLNDDAARLANLFQESMVDRCPFCEVPFDGCNTCNSVTCVACHNHFCGVCLTKGSCGVRGLSHGGYPEALEGRVKDKLAAFVDKHFASNTDTQLYRLFANRLASLGVRAAGQQSSPVRSVSLPDFLERCRVEVAERLKDERKGLIVDGCVRAGCQLSGRYRVTLEYDTDKEFASHIWNIEEVTYTEDGTLQLLPVDISDLPKEDDETWLISSIRTAVVAGKDGNLYQTRGSLFGVDLYQVTADGQEGDSVPPGPIVEVQGILGNRRLLDMQEYLAGLSPESLPTPVKSLLGAERNAALLTQITAPQQPICKALNEYQQLVVDMTRLSSAKVVVGPPGTGKSRTIVALISQMVAELPPKDIIVVTSEKNGAVEAVAAHLQAACMSPAASGRGGGACCNISNVSLFEKVAAFAPPVRPGDAARGRVRVGDAVRALTMQKKMEIHPEMPPAKSLYDTASDVYQKLAREAHTGVQQRLSVCITAVEALEDDGMALAMSELQETLAKASLKDGPDDLKAIAAKLRSLADEVEPAGCMPKDEAPSTKAKALKELQACAELAELLVSGDGGNKQGLEQVYKQVMDRLQAWKDTAAAVLARMKASTRVMLSTIGSAHRVHQAVWPEMAPVEDDDDDVRAQPYDFDYCSRDLGSLRFHYIIDECSTVPPYEVAALGMIGTLGSVTIVGDPNQLRPYWPPSSNPDHIQAAPRSIFDDARVERTYLQLQYRVPRLIANILNKHVYNGRYKTYVEMPFDPNPLLLVDVPYRMPNDNAVGGGSNGVHSESGSRGGNNKTGGRDRPPNSNDDEARKVAELLVRRYAQEHVLVITPYRDQVHAIRTWVERFLGKDSAEALKLSGKVITVDQSQGQEADVVIVSLTNPRPTRFLNKNRLNVLFSRVRKRLLLVTDVGVTRRFTSDLWYKSLELAMLYDMLTIGSPYHA